MKLQEYLRKHGIEKLITELHIQANRHEEYSNLVCLKYSQTESPMESEIVRQCRGIILDEDNDWKIVSYPYDKFFNYGEKHAPTIDWNTARVYEKLDGSLMVLYYYKGFWQVQTSGRADAGGGVGSLPFSFRDLFWNTWKELKYSLPLQTNRCYMFELCNPYNRVVVQHTEVSLTLCGVRNLDNLLEEDPLFWAEKYGWATPSMYSLNSLPQIVKASEFLDPVKSEGYVVCDNNFTRIKIKSPNYVDIAFFAKQSFNSKRMVRLVVLNEGAEFLNYFPEWKEHYDGWLEKYNSLIANIEKDYCHFQQITDQKDFALAIKHLPYSSILFSLRNGKTTSIKQALCNTTIDKLQQLLE